MTSDRAARGRLIGLEREVARLAAFLEGDGGPLVLLPTGAQGIGKTALLSAAVTRWRARSRAIALTARPGGGEILMSFSALADLLDGLDLGRDVAGLPLSQRHPSGATTLEELFCLHANVLAFVTGHEHQNFVEHHECAADQPPTPVTDDFWEVSTAAHIDWPQQARMIELVQDGGEMKMVLTILDHAGPPQPGAGPAADQVLRLASIGREIAYNDYQGGRFTGGRGDRDDRNLIVPLGRPFPCDEDPPDEGDPPGAGACAPGSAGG